MPVSIAAGLAWLAALRRRPYRRDLVWLGALLPLGVVAQAVLGGFTVKGALDYGWVMGHFALSMLILVAAVVLVWRASQSAEPVAPRRSSRPRRQRRDRSHASAHRPTLVLVAARAACPRRADDLRRHRRHRRGSPRGRLSRAEDQPPRLRRARHDGLRDPSSWRDRARVRPGGASLVWWLARRRAARRGGAAAADGAVRAARAAGGGRVWTSTRRTCRPSSCGCMSGWPACRGLRPCGRPVRPAPGPACRARAERQVAPRARIRPDRDSWQARAASQQAPGVAGIAAPGWLRERGSWPEMPRKLAATGLARGLIPGNRAFCRDQIQQLIVSSS